MWKPEHRLAADRRGLRYPSDLTEAEWAIVAGMIPPPTRRAQQIKGRKRHILVDTLGLPVECCRSSRRYSGPRRRLPLAVPGATTIPVHRTHFC